jgi:hypothetical protein
MSGVVVRLGAGRHRVVTAFRLPQSARTRLRELLGGGEIDLIDIRDADGTEDLVVMPSASRQLIRKLSSAFPNARVVVMELEDVEHGIRLGGPVTRAQEAGADGYYVAGSLEQFAALIARISDAPVDAISVGRPAELMATEHELEDMIDVILRRQCELEAARIRRGQE